jgi:hypothetical protein
MTRVRIVAYHSTVALAPSLAKNKDSVSGIAEPAVRLVSMI